MTKRLLLAAVLTVVACGKSTAPSASTPSAAVASAGAGDSAATTSEKAAPMDAREAAQWGAAREGEPEELARLASLVGCEGLRDRADDPQLRMTALQAMQYCGDFSELPFLAQVGATGKNDEAKLALDAIVELAARPRRATDPEDADELHAGCAALLDLARAKDAEKDRRVVAIRALRMLADRGCVKRQDIPADLDVH